MKTIRDKYIKQRKRKFIDRESETSIFTRQLEVSDADFNVLFFYGIGGVGKSFLLDELETICQGAQVKHARFNMFEVHDKIKILRDMRVKVSSSKLFSPFEKFDNHLKHYLELIGVLKDQGAFNGLLDLVAGLGLAADPTGAVGKIANGPLMGGIKFISSFLKKADIDFYLNASQFLTQTFQDGANRSVKSKFVILFDSYEHTSEEMDYWIQNEFIPGLSTKFFIVIAGREMPNNLWTDSIANGNTKVIELLNFNSYTTQLYLETLGIKERDITKEIFDVTDGHPLSISLHAELGTDRQTRMIVSSSVIERIFSQVKDEDVLSLLRTCSVLRFFDLNTLRTINPNFTDTVFQRLQEFSFVRNHIYGAMLHELVRARIQEEMTRIDYNRIQDLHQRALAYYKNETRSERAEKDKSYFYQMILETIYHQLSVSEDEGIELFVSTFLKMDDLYEKNFMYTMLREADEYSIHKSANKNWVTFCRGRLAYSDDRLSDSISYYKDIADQNPTDDGSDLIVYVGSRLSRALAETNQLDLAITYAKRSLRLSDEMGNVSERARALNALANAFQHQGKPTEVLLLLSDDTIESMTDSLQQGEAYTQVAICHRDLGNFELSIRYGWKCLDVWSKIDYALGTGIAKYNLGSTYLLAENYGQSEKLLDEAKSQFENLKSAIWVARCLTRQGELLLKSNKLEDAIKKFNESLEIRESIGDKYGILIVKELLASLLLKTSKFEMAEGLYNEIEQVARMYGNNIYMIKANIGLSKISLIKNDLRQASQYAFKAKEVVGATGMHNNSELDILLKEIVNSKNQNGGLNDS